MRFRLSDNSDNEFLKEFFENLLLDAKLCNNCTLIKFRSQLSKFLNIPAHVNRSSKCQCKKIKYCLNSYFDKYWHNMVHNDIYDNNKKGGNKLRTYRLIKNNILCEPYLNLRNFEKRKYIAQIRTSAHKLKIETGHYNSHNAYINPEEIICNQCPRNTKEDEFHFLLRCDKYKCISFFFKMSQSQQK